ncbi:MAG TPA: phosphoribosylaminoimidazolesuccinocarboxamide synthase [Candidatus Kapabacteria bacterium]|nr:phosphoribosylaminoimidazolesuccinocarboxamide synthase [Candidatus Kapabacteria bacterium]
MEGLKYSQLKKLGEAKRGKVRDVYNLGDKLLFVSTDRISAFDVIMEEAIPGKGKILNQISKFWFSQTKHIVENHFLTDDISNLDILDEDEKILLNGRAMLVNIAKVFPIECVVRGYIAGSAWNEYQSNGVICGNNLPEGLLEYGKLPEPIFTPATKEESGHDQNINFDEMSYIIGSDIANQLKELSLSLYNYASEFLDSRGIILADTKFEFGLTSDNKIILIDEALTPDSSRFWLKEKYIAGAAQYNFDKQVLRDYLLTTTWNKAYPPPTLPIEIIKETLGKYKEAYLRITGAEIIL